MFRPGHALCSIALGALIAGAGLIATPPAPASAQGLFEFLFGNLQRAIPAPSGQPFTPFDVRPAPSEQNRSSGGGGPQVAFCVRLCDGRYFPIQPHANVSPAETCNSFCPAAQTKIFRGSVIDHAVGPDGHRYSDLPKAFAYRDKLVPGCTCNGRDRIGLAHTDPASDPTLRPGDIVATNNGLVAYTGRDRNKQASFTPIDVARVSRSMRERLADVQVRPRVAAPETTGSAAPAPYPAPPARAARRGRVSDRVR